MKTAHLAKEFHLKIGTVSIYQDFWKFEILTWGWLLRFIRWTLILILCFPYELISKSWVIWCKCVEMHCNLSRFKIFFQVAFQNNYFRFLWTRENCETCIWLIFLGKNCWKLTVIVCWHVIFFLWWLMMIVG